MERVENQTVGTVVHPAQKGKLLGLKDLVLSVLLSCLALVVSVGIMLPFGMLDQRTAMLLGSMVPPLLCGIIYVLMITKSPRIGTYFVFSAVFGVFYLISGSLMTGLFFFGAGILGELSMIGGWGKKWRGVVPYLIHWLCYTYAATIQLLIMRDSMVATYIGMGMDAATAEATVTAYALIMTDPLMVVVSGTGAVLCSVLGYFVGTKVFGKRFKAAGIA